MAPKLQEAWGQPMIVENRPGGGTIIGVAAVAKAAPDGYTLVMVTPSFIINATGLKKLPYDSIRDFAPVTLFVTSPLLLVAHPSLPVRNVKELIALAKSRPGQIDYASAGTGSPTHLGMEIFRSVGAVMNHVPYKGGQAPAVIDQISGQVQLAFTTAITVMQHVKVRQLKPLAISTKERFPAMPELPTVEEAGVAGFEGSSWNGIVAPAGTPRDVLTKVHQELATFLKMPETREKLIAQGAIAGGGSSEEFQAYIRSELAKWTKVAKFANVRLE